MDIDLKPARLLFQEIDISPRVWQDVVHAWLAVWNALLISQDWAEDAAASTAEAGHLAERAVALDPLDSKALSIAGLIRADLHRRPAEAVALYDRALTLNPNLALTWGLSGAAQAYRGDLDEARLRLDRAHRLAPLHPQGFLIEPARCAVALLRGEMDAAVVSGRSATELNPAYAAARKPYLAALGHLGLHAEAGDVRARLLAAEPGFTVQRFLAATPYELPAHRAKLADGLRAAGVPEG